MTERNGVKGRVFKIVVEQTRYRYDEVVASN